MFRRVAHDQHSLVPPNAKELSWRAEVWPLRRGSARVEVAVGIGECRVIVGGRFCIERERRDQFDRARGAPQVRASIWECRHACACTRHRAHRGRFNRVVSLGAGAVRVDVKTSSASSVPTRERAASPPPAVDARGANGPTWCRAHSHVRRMGAAEQHECSNHRTARGASPTLPCDHRAVCRRPCGIGEA